MTPHLIGNATGCVGVVLGLHDGNSLRYACSTDAGSSETSVGRDSLSATDFDAEHVAESIINRADGDYNEWGIANYQVLGVFAVAPFEIATLENVCLPEDAPALLASDDLIVGFRQSSPSEVCSAFLEYEVFGFDQCKICRWVDGQPVYISHNEIYSANAL
ncbi:MAG: hypothetical protein ABJ308_01795 [Halieaceae bacterium]